MRVKEGEIARMQPLLFAGGETVTATTATVWVTASRRLTRTVLFMFGEDNVRVVIVNWFWFSQLFGQRGY